MPVQVFTLSAFWGSLRSSKPTQPLTLAFPAWLITVFHASEAVMRAFVHSSPFAQPSAKQSNQSEPKRPICLVGAPSGAPRQRSLHRDGASGLLARNPRISGARPAGRALGAGNY